MGLSEQRKFMIDESTAAAAMWVVARGDVAMPIRIQDLMTPAQIQGCVVQPDVIKEAYGQVEKRLSDMLETKKSFEQRASTLLASFSALALALIGAGGAFFTSQPLVGHAPKGLPYAFFIASIPMILALWSMVRALQPVRAGNLGSTPDFWLRPGVIDAAERVNDFAPPEVMNLVSNSSVAGAWIFPPAGG
jgi:hypothetical protein